MRREILSVFTAAAVATSAFVTPATAQDVTIRAATTFPADSGHPLVTAYKEFANQVELLSGGTMAVEMFWGGSLGGDREIYEQIQSGSLQFTVASTGPLAGFYPEIDALSIPYLFQSAAHAREFLRSSPTVAEMMSDMTEQTGLRVLLLTGSDFRNFTNNTRQFTTPADMEGLRMRTMESPVMMAMTRGLGAEPTPIAFNELIPSLLTGVVTGQENAVSTVRNFNIYEAQQYMSIDEHLFSVTSVVTNDDFFRGLTDAQRAIFINAVDAMSAVFMAEAVVNYAADLQYLQEAGMEIHFNTPEEKAMFAEAAQPAVIEFLNEQVGAELVQGILADAAAAADRLYGLD